MEWGGFEGRRCRWGEGEGEGEGEGSRSVLLPPVGLSPPHRPSCPGADEGTTWDTQWTTTDNLEECQTQMSEGVGVRGDMSLMHAAALLSCATPLWCRLQC